MILDLYIQNYIRQFGELNREFWNYEDGCVLISLQAMFEATGDDIYKNIIQTFMNRYICEDGTIRYYDKQEYNLDRIPSGRVLFFLYHNTGEVKYRNAIECLMNQLREQPRTECGSFWHKSIYPHQIWLDGLYMAAPFYLLYEKNFHESGGYEDIMRQFSNARKFLYDEKKHLYYHAYDEKKCQFWTDPETGLSANFWSRAMGWYTMALADCYELMPEEQKENKEILKNLWQETIAGILEYQEQESGLFYQLTALPEVEGNYLETSSSAMFAYSMLKGYRIGVFGREYQKKALEILVALVTRKVSFSNGCLHIGDICAGAGLGPADRPERDGSIRYYLSEPVVSDEQKGVASVIMAYSEWLKCNQTPQNWHELCSVQLNDVRILRHGGKK